MFLKVLTLGLALVVAVARAQVPPAVLAGISANGLQTTVNSVLPTVFAKFQNMQLPGMSGDHDTISYDFEGIVINRSVCVCVCVCELCIHCS